MRKRNPFRMAPMIVLMIVGLAGACATEAPASLNRPALRASQARSIIASVSKPAFLVGSSGNLLAAAIEGLKMERHATDPAAAIRAKLVSMMARRFALEKKDARGFMSPSPDVSALVAAFKTTDLVLDIRTTSWSLVRNTSGQYGMRYASRLQLIDTRSRSVLVAGECSSAPSNANPGPFHDELVANEGAGLAELVLGVAEYCTEDFRTRLLGLY